MISPQHLEPFRRRIRFLTALKHLWIGLSICGVIAVIWAILDFRGVLYTEWIWLAALLLTGATLGFASGFLSKPTHLDIARSIDKRAKLKDRIGSAIEANDETEFAAELSADASRAIEASDPKKLYPVRLGWLPGAGTGTGIAAFLIFGLVSTSILTGAASPTEKEEMKKEATRLEELRKAIFDDTAQKKQTPADLVALQKDLMKLQRDFEKGRIDPKEVMLRKEELNRKADALTKLKASDALADVQKGESAMAKLEAEALKQAGLEKVDMSDVRASQEDFDGKMAEAESQMNSANQKAEEAKANLESLSKAMSKPGLTEAHKKALAEQLEQAKSNLNEAIKNAQKAKKALDGLKLSKEARDVLSKLYADPLMKEIQTELERLRKTLKDAAKNGAEAKTLTPEEIEALREKMEEFLKSLSDDAARKEYLEKLLAALKKAKEAGQCQGVCMGMGLGMGLGLSAGSPSTGPDNDKMLFDTGSVNKSDPIQGKGKGNPVFAPTERDPLRPGPEMTFEIKAPTFKGTRSSVPYQKVLPSYKQKAEAALKKQEIPKEHQDRVKRYFDSLNK